MGKTLTNTTTSDVFVQDAGTVVPASSSYVIPPQYYGMWMNSANIVTLINDGTITVASSLRTLPTTTLAIEHLQLLAGLPEDILFDNSTNSFAATNVQSAIEEGGGTALNTPLKGVKRDSTGSFAAHIGTFNTVYAPTIGGLPGSGTNTTGVDVSFVAGSATGTGNSGNILFKTSNAASSIPALSTSANFVTTSVSTYSTAFNAGAAANNMLVVELIIPNGSSGNSITYNGVALTKLTSAGSAATLAELWYLLAPATGSNTLTVVLQNPAVVIIEAMTISGVNQTTPFGTAATNNGSSNAATVTATTVSGQWVLDVLSASAVPTISGGQTAIWNGNNGAGLDGASSYKTATTTSTISSYSFASSTSWSMISVGINGLGGGSTNTLVEVARITPTGRLGVGTTAPAYPLDINGTAGVNNLLIRGTTSGYILQTAAATTTPYFIVWPSAQGAANNTLVNDGAGNLSWSVPKINAIEVSATADATTTSSTPALLTTMTITPSAGTYMVWFSASTTSNGTNCTQTFAMYVNGTIVPQSSRTIQPYDGGTLAAPTAIGAVAINGLVTVTTGAVEIRWSTTGGTATCHQRTLNLLRVS